MNRTFFRTRWCAAGFLVSALLLTGCSQPVGSVTGKVTYNGKPLKGGSVTFVSDEGGQSASGEIGETGTYTVPKILGGKYKVCVDTSYLSPTQQVGGGYTGSGGSKGRPPSAAPPAPKASGPPPGAEVPEGYTPSNPAEMAAATAAKKYVQIPEKYKTPEKTDLVFTFEGGSQTFNIDLK
jgi:hypothetical protein